MPAKTIAKKINKCRSAIVDKRNLLGIKYLYKGAGRKWTEEEIEFIKQNYLDMTYREVGEKINRSKGSISQQVSRLGLRKLSYKGEWTQREIKFLKENVDYLNYIQIANRLKRSVQACRTKAHDLGIVSNEDPNGYKIRRSHMQYIEENFETKTDSELANHIGCSIQAVMNYRIKNDLRKMENTDKTNIERIVTEILIRNNIDFKYEPHMFGLRPDFYIEKFNLIIEVQGDYFHCNPKKFKQGPVNKMQKEQILHDYTKKCIYLDKGLEVLYLWGDDIINDIDKVIYEIKKSCSIK